MPTSQNRKAALGMSAAGVATALIGLLTGLVAFVASKHSLIERVGADDDVVAGVLTLLSFTAVPVLSALVVRAVFAHMTGIRVRLFLPAMAAVLVLAAIHVMAGSGPLVIGALAVFHALIVGAWLGQMIDKRPKMGTPLSAVPTTGGRFGTPSSAPAPARAPSGAPPAAAPPPPFIS